MKVYSLSLIEPMLFLKFGILMAIIASLTMVEPLALTVAHMGAKKLCGVVMKAEDCVFHC